MAQKKTATVKTARKTKKTLAKVPARQAAPLLEVAKVVEKPVAVAQLRQAPSAPSPTSSTDFGDLAVVGRENLEACVKCGTIAAKGVEALGSEVMSIAQATFEADLAAAKDIMAAKDFQEAIDLQTSFVQARLERVTSETAKFGELSLRLAGQALEPLRSRFEADPWTTFRPFGL